VDAQPTQEISPAEKRRRFAEQAKDPAFLHDLADRLKKGPLSDELFDRLDAVIEEVGRRVFDDLNVPAADPICCTNTGEEES
jgi:hypothetical protein